MCLNYVCYNNKIDFMIKIETVVIVWFTCRTFFDYYYFPFLVDNS